MFHSYLLTRIESSSSVPRKNRLLFHLSALLCSLLVLTAALLGPDGIRVAHAASTTPLPYNANGNSENPPLVLYNAIQQHPGPPWVQHHPVVYLVFWGPEWNQEDGVINQIMATFRALPGSQYNNILSQYSDSSDYLHNDVRLGAAVVDTTTPPSNLDIGFEGAPLNTIYGHAQIRNEADNMIASNHWSVNQDSQIIVFPQKGSVYYHGSQWCGVHAYNSMAASPYAYAEIQYGDQWYGASQAPCDPTGDTGKDIAWSAVHEYAETATDPVIYVSPTIGGQWWDAYSGGWHTQDGTKNQPQEVADLCAGYDGFYGDPAANDYTDLRTGTQYSLPLLWSNADNGCVTTAWPDYEVRYNQNERSIWKYTGTPLAGWQEISTPNTQTASVVAGVGHVYQLQLNGTILVYSGTSTTWTTLDATGTAEEIVLSSTGKLYKEDQDSSAWQYLGGTSWTQLSSSANSAPLGSLTAGPNGALYSIGLKGVWMYTGTPITGWKEIDNTTTNGYAAAASLVATPNGKLYELRYNATTNTETVWTYNGTPLSWKQIGTQASLAITSDGNSNLYRLASGGTLWQYSGSGTTWTSLQNPSPTQVINFTASSTGQVFEILSTGAVWMLNGGQWTQIDDSTTSYEIASDIGGTAFNTAG